MGFFGRLGNLLNGISILRDRERVEQAEVRHHRVAEPQPGRYSHVVETQKVEIERDLSGKVSKLVVNGKAVDPESPDGKRIIERIERQRKRLEEDMGRVGEDLNRMSKRLHEDMDDMFGRKPPEKKEPPKGSQKG